MKAFSTYHPIVLFTYFVSVIVFSMFYMHPIYLTISFIVSFTLAAIWNGKKAISSMVFCLIMFLTIAISNVLFSHHGVTILFYMNDNPITLESILYGMAMAAMIISVILWFNCYNIVMTSDKFIYLFGRIIPTIALIISMTLRLVPKFRAQIKLISNSQKTMGMDYSSGNIFQRIKSGIRIISILITWGLENAIETADSMKARGYGLKGRSTFSIFRFDKRDGAILTLILTLVGINIMGYIAGYSYFIYYPYVSVIELSSIGFVLYISYFVLMIIPLVIEIKEEMKWRSLRLII